MLIVYKNVVINLDTVHSFWKADKLQGCPEELVFIVFTDTTSRIEEEHLNFLPFTSPDDRDKAYQDILFAYAEDKKVFAIVTNPKEEKNNDSR